MGGKGDRPTVENRWWVDQGKDASGRPIERPPAQFGGRFFRTGDGFEQERARPKTLVEDFAPKSRAAGTAQIAGRSWNVRTGSDGDRIYLRGFDRTSVLVISGAGRGVTEAYVSSLAVP